MTLRLAPLAALFIACLAGCHASAPAGPPGPPLPVTSQFTPNAVTLSTSEGAPYGDCDFWRNDPAGCAQQTNLGYGPTKVMRLYICLSGEVELGACSNQPAVTGPLSSAMVADIDQRLAAFAGTGMRLMIRFTYNFGPIGPTAMDAPISLIEEHLSQLAPALLRNRDLIFALEAGFIGTWGEWHDSTSGNGAAAPEKALLDAERAAFGGIFPILVRYPGNLVQYLGSATPDPDFGLHDDYYASGTDDGATWNPCVPNSGYCDMTGTAAGLQAFGAAVASTTMFAGEFGAAYPALQGCSALDAYSHQLMLQSIALYQPDDVTAGLQGEGCALSFLNKVGARLELQQAALSGAGAANQQLDVSLTLANTGYGRVIRARPATLLFLSGNSVVHQLAIPLAQLDLRQLAPSSTPAAKTFSIPVALPGDFPSSGAIAVELLVPDPAPSLQKQAAYALPLNSVDALGKPVFDPATGYNSLGSFEAR